VKHFFYFFLLTAHPGILPNPFGVAIDIYLNQLSDILYACTNWIYFLFAAERTAVIFFPLKMKNYITMKNACSALVCGLLLSLSMGILWFCLTRSIIKINKKDGVKVQLAWYSSSFIAEPIATLALLLALGIRVCSQARKRLTMQQTAANRSSKQHRTVVVLITIGLLHSIMQATCAIGIMLNFITYIADRNIVGATAWSYVPVDYYTMQNIIACRYIFPELLSFASLWNFPLYILTIREFRALLCCCRKKPSQPQLTAPPVVRRNIQGNKSEVNK
jgi:hypothetical protein